MRILENDSLPNVPVIAIIGPSGTGKTRLAQRVALMLTRSGNRNIVLVDADIHSRGLTAHVEDLVGGGATCCTLHDIVVGGPRDMEPMSVSHRTNTREDWRGLPDEGQLFFLPSVDLRADHPWEGIANLDSATLLHKIAAALRSAAAACDAACVVVDTTSIAEPCAAAVVSLADLIIALGSPDKRRDIVNYHQQRLHDFNVSLPHDDIELIFNQWDPEVLEPGDNSHLIPRLDGIQKRLPDAEALADTIDFDDHVVAILRTVLLRHNLAQLAPPTLACLPAAWRSTAKFVSCAPSPRSRAPTHHFTVPAMNALFMAATDALVLVLLTGESRLSRPLSLGFWLLLCAGCLLFFVSAYLAVDQFVHWLRHSGLRQCLVDGNVAWILRRLRLSPEQRRSSSADARSRKLSRNLNRMRSAFAAIGSLASNSTIA